MSFDGSRAIRTALVAGILGACADEAPLQRGAAPSNDAGRTGTNVDAAHSWPLASCPNIVLDVLTPQDGEPCDVDPRLECGFTGGLTPCLVHGSVTKQCVGGKWKTLSQSYPTCVTGGTFGGTGGFPVGIGGMNGGRHDAGIDASAAGSGGRPEAGGGALDSGDSSVQPRD